MLDAACHAEKCMLPIYRAYLKGFVSTGKLMSLHCKVILRAVILGVVAVNHIRLYCCSSKLPQYTRGTAAQCVMSS
jgi:hypothetical protein